MYFGYSSLKDSGSTGEVYVYGGVWCVSVSVVNLLSRHLTRVHCALRSCAECLPLMRLRDFGFCCHCLCLVRF